MKKQISTLLALTTLVSILASCGGEAGTTQTTTAPSGETTEPAETTSQFESDDLPADLDFEGAEVNWLCGDYFGAYYGDLWADDQNGNMVNDTIYTSRRSLEERLNVSLAVEQYEYNWNNRTGYYTHVQNLILSGDTTYDSIIGGPITSLLVEGGYFADMKANQYINFSKPWWNQDALSVIPGDKVFFATGDATLSLVKHVLCMYFNQDLLDSFGYTESMYDVVRAGEWTFDKLDSMIKDTYGDLNGDGIADPDDRYGLVFGDQNKLRCIPGATQVHISERDGDEYKLVFISERNNDIYTRIQTMISDNPSVRMPQHNSDTNTDSFASFGGNYVSKIFTNGNALFNASLVGDAQTILDNSKFTVGMIPYPKYDENQDDYYTAPQRMAHIYIPSTISGEQYDRAGAVLEGWASECYRSVMPAFFETSLKVRYSTDNDMAEIFDLLRTNTVIDLDHVFSADIALNVDFFKKATGADAFMSTAEGLREQAETQLAELVAALKGEN